jgi:hypothetical protein
MGRCGVWAKLGRVALGIAGLTGFGFGPFPLLSNFYFYFKQSLNSNQNLNSNHTQNNLKLCTSMNATTKFKPMIKF